MSLAAIAEVVGGTVDPAVAGVMVTGEAFVDSRSPVAGGLFAAIEGERVDGHAFAERAIAGGAAAVLGSRSTGAPTVVVSDVLTALAALAKHVMGRLPSATVIAITGSQGKTSTKD